MQSLPGRINSSGNNLHLETMLSDIMFATTSGSFCQSRPRIGECTRTNPQALMIDAHVKRTTANNLYCILVLGVVIACSGCVSPGPHREKIWVQPAVAADAWSADETGCVARVVDDVAARHGLKPWPFFHPKRLITCKCRLSFFQVADQYILTAAYTRNDRHGPIIVIMDHDLPYLMFCHTKKERECCRGLWNDLESQLRLAFGDRVTQTRKPAPSAPD